jgi:serine/threonine protein kinase/WD40 repeat protein
MTTETMNWVGLLLAGGRYQVKAKLGEGGMGFVYRARHRKLDTDVVIKVPRPALLQDPEFVARFTREIRALVKLEHPHVVKIIDVDDHEGVPFAVMSYLAGGSLEDRQPLGQDGKPLPTPADELGDWLEDVAEALDFVHKKGFVHRDVKPANILFDGQGNVYLSDFGVAKAAAETRRGQVDASLTGTGVVLGTPQYMAAEMALGAKYDGRVDQYALAVTVYEMLCGRVPFQGATAAAILLKQTSEQPKPVHLVCESVPKGVSDVVQKALAKDPSQRFPTCTAFAKAVVAAIVASPNQGRSPAAARQTSRVPVVSCPACSKTHRLPPTAWGKRVKCPDCLNEFQAPNQPSTRTLRRPAELETGKTPQAQIDTSPHRLPTTQDERSPRPARSGLSPLKYLLVAGMVLLLLLLGTTTLLLVRSVVLEHKPGVGGTGPDITQKQPKLFLGYQAITLKPGDQKYIEVTLERNGYEGPIELHVEKLPNKVSYDLPKISAERSTTQLKLIAAADAEDIDGTAKVVAKAGTFTLEDSVKITVMGRAASPAAATASVKLRPVGNISLLPGTSKTVEVRIERQGYDGAVHVQLDAASGSVTATPLIIPAGETTGRLELKASAEAGGAEAEATLLATTSASSVKDSQPVRIIMLKRPEPRIAALDPVVLSPGESKTVDIQVDRNGWDGPISLTLGGLPEGVASKPQSIPAGQDTFHVELVCAASAPEGERQTQVMCLAGTATLAAPVSISVQRLEPLHVLKGHSKQVLWVAYRGPKTAVSFSGDKTLREWDLDTNQERKVLTLRDVIASPVSHAHASISPDGRWCAIAAGAQSSSFAAGTWVHQVQLWDLEAGKEKKRLLGRTGPQKLVTWVEMSDNGRWILCGSIDEYMRLYDVTTTNRDPVMIGPAPKNIDYVAFVPSAAGGAAGGTPTAPLAPGGFNSGPGLPVNPPPGAGWQNPLLAGSKYPIVVYGRQGGDISFWDLEKGKEVGLCSGHSGAITWVAFSQDGAKAASVSTDRSVRVWDLKTFKQVAMISPSSDSPTCVVFSPDGKRLLCGGNMGFLRVWDIAASREVRKYKQESAAAAKAVACLACSPDGRNAVTGHADGTVQLWAMPK